MARISMLKRQQCSELLRQGLSQSEIAKRLSISRKSVQIIEKEKKEGLGVEDRPKSGRPPVLK